ncbi:MULTISPECIES: hypothetical protein [Paracoccus]|uniref:hypothetical protein n=1 Tax=Paracoccus TaxID=265 RepID=UPI00086997D1|nr:MULTISPECIES: hypothetical protein [Paracoccus]ODT60967.1 MAG: hypothetical protein ABS73_03780 [Paracoccus sp. SCN 68-21]
MGFLGDLLRTPDAQSDPHHWAATFMAHRDVGLGLWAVAAMIIDVWTAVILVSVGYLVLWEGAQLWRAARQGKRILPAAWDGFLDTVALTSGCYAAACLVKGLWMDAIFCWFAMLIVISVGWAQRAGRQTR